MSTDEPGSTLYAITYSDRVQDVLVRLGRVAQSRGDGERFVDALREFHRRLCVYPQFGDPLMDLRVSVGQIRLGVVPPLTMRYGVLEERRSVIVVGVPVLLPRAA